MTPDWNSKWDDWQNLVWQKLEKIEERVVNLERFKWKVVGGSVVVIGLIEIVSYVVRLKGV